MGMFDTIKCEVPLPDPVPPEKAWLQTKDFARTLATYTIRADGTLWTDEYGDPTQLTEYHGFLNFYTFENDVWYEYKAKFTDGKLQGIETVIEGRKHE